MLHLLFILAFWSFPGHPDSGAGEKGIDQCKTENYSWQGGEEVTYTLYYQLNFIWLPAGKARFRGPGVPSSRESGGHRLWQNG